MNLAHLSKKDFSNIIENAHQAVFQDNLPSDFFRYDFALVTYADDSSPISYALVHELSNEDVELTYGGTIVEQRGVASKNSFLLVLGRLKEMGYKNTVIQVENKNTPMLRLALSENFLIIGTRVSSLGKNFVLLNKNLEE